MLHFLLGFVLINRGFIRNFLKFEIGEIQIFLLSINYCNNLSV